MSAHLLYQGVFDDEQSLILLNIMEKLMWRAIATLKAASAQLPVTNKLAIAMQSVPTWTSNVQREEAEIATTLFPQIRDLYRYVYLRFIQKTHHIEKTAIDVVPFHIFLHSFYTFMSESHHVINDQVAQLSPTDIQLLTMSWIRSALYNVTRGSVIMNSDTTVGPWDSVSLIGTNDDNDDDNDDNDNDNDDDHTEVQAQPPQPSPQKAQKPQPPPQQPTGPLPLRKSKRSSAGLYREMKKKQGKRTSSIPRFY